MNRLITSLMVVFLLTSCAKTVEPSAQPVNTIQVPQNTIENLPEPTNTIEKEIPTQEETQKPEENLTTPETQNSSWVAYVSFDGNIRLLDVKTGDQKDITLDASTGTNIAVGESRVQYNDPKWSSDGNFLAFTMEKMTQLADRADFQDGIMLYDADSGELKILLENQQLAGFRWQPEKPVLSYALITEPAYFTGRGEVDSTLAHGIFAINVLTNEKYELVKPQVYSLVSPRWSADGTIVSFNEVYLMEGSGQFAYFNLETQEYVSWEKPIGNYDLSSSGEKITYDNLTYVPGGDERIYMNNLSGENEELFSAPLSENEYAFAPIFSPDDSDLVYQVASLGTEPVLSRLFVKPMDGGEPRFLIEGEIIGEVIWSPDGTSLLLSVGPYQESQLVLVNYKDGTSKILTEGWMAAWQPN
ncbi:MAG: hypothetical protein CL609_25325 [Anaerolineaceae bacterium]|nr:hypothetical protein [Anaerolineaceae bacterium]